MRIALAGARGSVGQEVLKLATEKGHFVYQINRTEEKGDNTDKTEYRVANLAESYDDTVKAFKGADALIHLSSVPNPVDKDDHYVHNNNISSSYNGFRAAVEVGIKRIAFASSVNALGLLYGKKDPYFEYFPIDEEHVQKPSDSYALAKQEAEIQADSFCYTHDDLKIASLRIHQVASKAECKKDHDEDETVAKRQLWAWVSPAATARACLAAVEADFEGHQIFNIVAPDTTQDTPTEDLHRKYFANVPIKGDLSGNKSFFTSAKAEKILGWKHTETE